MRRWSLSDLALQRPVTVGMALVAVLLLGILGLSKMPLSFLPLNQQPRMFVRVNITRTSPEVLERDVIRPVEEAVAGIRDLDRIQVGSGSWGVRINLDFEPGTDIDARKLELRDRVERVRGDLPEFVQSIEIGSYSNYDDPMMEVQVSSGTDLSEDYYLIEERVVRRIERIPGVARVELEGVSPHELEVAVDLQEAARSGISLDHVRASVRDARQGRSLGVLRADRVAPGVRSPADAASPERFERLPLPRNRPLSPATDPSTGLATSLDRAPVQPGTESAQDDIRFAQLGEVADVRVQPEDRRRSRRLNGRKAINLEIFAQAGSSAVEVSRRIQEELQAIGEDPALDGIDLLIFEDHGRTILETLADLRDAGIYGGLLGLVVLFGFLHRWRTTLAASVSIPLSVFAAGGVLFLRGDELNCVVMLGLVLGVGMLIDNAVVIVEAVAQHTQRGEPALEAARKGAREVGFATIASTLSTVIVFIPLLATNARDEAAAYLRPLGMTFAIALTASLLVSQTAIPLLMGHVLRPRPKKLRHRLLDPLSRGYAWLVRTTLRMPRLTMLLGIGLAASAIYPMQNVAIRIGRAESQPNNLPIRLQIAGSRSEEQIGKIVQVLESAVIEHKDELGVDDVSCSYSDHWGNCRLYPAEPFQSEAEVVRYQQRVAEVLPEQIGVEYRLGERDFDWRENRDPNVVEFALKGEDMGGLIELSERVAEHLRKKLPRGDASQPEGGGIDTISTPFDEGSREIYIELDTDRMRRLGLDGEQVAQHVSLAFQGVPLGTVRGPRGDVQLRLSALIDEEVEGAGMALLRDLRLPTVGGEDVPLSSIADIGIARRPWWIQRVDRQTEARIKVRFYSTDSSANWQTVDDALSDFPFPPGYSWGRGTSWRSEREAGNDMLINLALCLLLVYAVMASLFESYVQPMGILLICLLGAFGAPWALWATSTTLDTTALVGFFILIGVVVNNGIMLVDKVTQLRAEGMPRADALATAGQQRLRPILMTMTTTVLGLLPMLIHHPTLAGIYYHAIAIVVAGGLLTSTFVTLVVLPSAYTILEGMSQSAGRAWRHAFALGQRRDP